MGTRSGAEDLLLLRVELRLREHPGIEESSLSLINAS